VLCEMAQFTGDLCRATAALGVPADGFAAGRVLLNRRGSYTSHRRALCPDCDLVWVTLTPLSDSPWSKGEGHTMLGCCEVPLQNRPASGRSIEQTHVEIFKLGNNEVCFTNAWCGKLHKFFIARQF